MIAAVWAFVRPHVAYWVLAGGAVFAVHTWLTEHDARLLAEVQVKQSQQVVEGLKQQMAARQTETQKQVQVIVKEVAAAKTPTQQFAEIPLLSSQPLNAQLLPDAPSAVRVDLQPLVAQLGKCKEDAIELGACQKDAQNLESIALEKDKQIKDFQKKPDFWHRLERDGKIVACSVVGAAVGSVANGNRSLNAGIGAGVGAATCTLFAK